MKPLTLPQEAALLETTTRFCDAAVASGIRALERTGNLTREEAARSLALASYIDAFTEIYIAARG